MSKVELYFHRMTFAALIILAMGTFTSITLSALSHVLLFFPGWYFLGKFVKEKKGLPPWKFWGLLAVWGSCILSVIFNGDILENPFYHASKSKYFLMGLLSWFAFQYCCREYLTGRKIRLLLSLFLFFTTLASFSGIVEFFMGTSPIKAIITDKQCHPERACGLFGHWMSYAYGINFFIIIVSGLLLYRKDLEGYLNVKLAWAALGINTLGLFFSYTRGAWLGVLIGLPCFFFKKNKPVFFMSILVGGTLLGGSILLSERVRETFMSRNRIRSVDERFSLYGAAIKAFEERPVWGYGYRNFEPNVIDIKRRYDINYKEHGGHAHSNFLEHLASTGLVGGLSFVLFTLLWLVNSYRREDVVGKISFPVVISFIVSGMFQYTFGDGENLFLLMLLWAL